MTLCFVFNEHIFLRAYLGSPGITRMILPSQNSATTRSFFQPCSRQQHAGGLDGVHRGQMETLKKI